MPGSTPLVALAAVLVCAVPGGGQTKVKKNALFEGEVWAPDFPRHLAWLNTDRPLSLKDLRGKLVLLDFWTFCCINCMHIIPDLKKLETKYADELVVVGVHSAKFTNEKGTDQIRQAILRYGIRHPVINDNKLEVWQSYAVHSWPTLVLINPNGRIIGTHAGEGVYAPFDQVIGAAVPYFEAKGELKRGPLKLALESRPNTLLAFPGKVSAGQQRLFISDSDHNRILVTGPNGAVMDVIGSGAAGRRDGAFEDAEFQHPQGTAADGDLLYIADTENHLIRVAHLTTREVKTVLGSGRQATRFNVAGSGTAVDLSSPWALALLGGKLYIAMAGSHQIWVADPKTWEASPYAGSGREGRIDGRLAAAALAQPSGITTDGTELYFADSESSSIRVASGDSVKTLIGEDLFVFGDVDGPHSRARLQHPLGIVWNGGRLYVADTYNSKIKIVDPVQRTSATYAGTGKPGYEDGSLKAAQFDEPGGLAFLEGKLYVADTNNHVIRVIDPRAGSVRTLALTDLDKVARVEQKRFSGRLLDLPAARVGAGHPVIALDVALPPGYKFSPGAPFYFEGTSGNPQALRVGAAKPFHASPAELALETAPGKAELTLDAIIYYCTEKSTACYVDPVRLRVPVEVADGGPAVLNLTLPVKKPR